MVEITVPLFMGQLWVHLVQVRRTFSQIATVALHNLLTTCLLSAYLTLCFAQDPDACAEETDQLVTRQFAAIEGALADACPAVRVVAVSGLCQLLNTFWELIPAPIIAGNLKVLAGEFSILPSLRMAAFEVSWQKVYPIAEGQHKLKYSAFGFIY